MPGEYRAEAVVESLICVSSAGHTRADPTCSGGPRCVAESVGGPRGAGGCRRSLPHLFCRSSTSHPTFVGSEQGAIDVVTFTSSSTVTNFVTLIGEADLAQLLRDTVVACIGPITAEQRARMA